MSSTMASRSVLAGSSQAAHWVAGTTSGALSWMWPRGVLRWPYLHAARGRPGSMRSTVERIERCVWDAALQSL
jgi:hypothetical protein